MMPGQAIVLWLDDKTISGSVVSFNKMKHLDPTVESRFKEGDIVMAPCQGFPGKHRCVIAEIGPEGEAERKRLLLAINSKHFTTMVQQYVPLHKLPATVDVMETQTKEGEMEADIIIASDSSTGGAARKRKAQEAPLHHNDNTKQNKPEETDKQRQKRNKDLKKVAADLELTELSSIIGDANRTLDDQTEFDICTDIAQVLPALPQVSSVNSELTENKRTVYHLQSRVAFLEGSLSNLWNWTRQIQHDQQVMQQLVGGGEKQPSQQDVFEMAVTNTTSSTTCSEKDEEIVVAGFTISQLECKVSHLSSAPKVAALLFRTIFKEDEYMGKTLTGAAGKPQVDQEKLAIVYKIVTRKFPGYPMASLRHSLCDLLKPSRQKKNLN